MGTDHADGRIAELARHQGGAISRGQLLESGLRRGAIEHRVATGRLHWRHRGVYVVGHLAQAPLADEFAAMLACGDGALVGHHAAGAGWGFRPATFPPIDVTVYRGDARSHPGIRIHPVSAPLDPIDVRILDGLRVTAPARTLLDLAAVLSEREPQLTRSEAERRLVELISAARLPTPELNVRVCGREVDALWRAQRLVAEVDGYAYHSGREAFERDRRRDGDLQSAGLRVTRITWRQLTEEPLAVAALLAQLLSAAAR